LSSLLYAYNGYVQGVESPKPNPLCRPLYAFGLDDCFYSDELKLNEAHPLHLVAAWMKMLLTFKKKKSTSFE
jgi:hypothetical protein